MRRSPVKRSSGARTTSSSRTEPRRRRDRFASADRIVEGEYETAAQEQLYIEPQGMVATADVDDGITVWGSLQCPYYVHKALTTLFSLPQHKVRVVQMETGGGFGGKEEYPSHIAAHAALLARKAGRPVKIVYDRAEDMVATTKRHPSRTRLRTAVDRDGKLMAVDIDFVIDGGAYCTLSPVSCPRHHSRAWPLLLPQRADSQPGGGDIHPAARRLPWLRRATESVRARAPHERGRP